MSEQQAAWNWLSVLGLVSGVASIIGLPYAYVLYRKSERRKLLVYQVSAPLAFAEVLKTPGQQISILYEKPGHEATHVRGAYVQFVQIANIGREPIRSADLPDRDPLRLEIVGSHVLDVARVGVTRKLNFEVGAPTLIRRGRSYPLSFDFLDEQDGALLQVVTEDPSARIKLTGKVIGMPAGPVDAADLDKSHITTPIGCTLSAVSAVASVAATQYLLHYLLGTWKYWWLLFLPLATLLIPAIVTIPIMAALSPRGIQWRSEIGVPSWYHMLHMAREHFGDDIRYRAYRGALQAHERQLGSSRMESDKAPDGDEASNP